MEICCIIKPPSVAWRANIFTCLQAENIDIIAHKEFVYTNESIEVLYDHMDGVARALIAERYAHRKGVALLLNFTSIEHCINVIGRESDPRKCESHTIRALYGSRAEPEWLGSWHWFENAIHRPVDERERVRDLDFVFRERY